MRRCWKKQNWKNGFYKKCDHKLSHTAVPSTLTEECPSFFTIPVSLDTLGSKIGTGSLQITGDFHLKVEALRGSWDRMKFDFCHRDKTASDRKAFILAYGSQSIKEGHQGRHLETMGECCLLAGSLATSLVQPRTACLWMIPPMVGWALSHQRSRKCLTDIPTGQSNGGNSSTEMQKTLG